MLGSSHIYQIDVYSLLHGSLRLISYFMVIIILLNLYISATNKYQLMTYGWRASGARRELLKPYARRAYKVGWKELAVLTDEVRILYKYIYIYITKELATTWFAKSATECTTSASITWLEVENQTPNLREKTRKLHQSAVVTARWLKHRISGEKGKNNHTCPVKGKGEIIQNDLAEENKIGKEIQMAQELLLWLYCSQVQAIKKINGKKQIYS